MISQTWGVLIEYCSTIGNLFNPIVNLFWSIIDPLVSFGYQLKNLFSYLFTIPFNFLQILFNFLINLKNLFAWLFYGPFEAISVVFTSIFELIKLTYYSLIYPFMKIKDFISPAKDVVQTGVNVASRTEELRKVWADLQISIAPLQRVWFGIKRITDSVYHTYLDKIKPTPKKQRYMMTAFLVLSVLVVFIFILYKLYA
jgi:hypothetical protein